MPPDLQARILGQRLPGTNVIPVTVGLDHRLDVEPVDGLAQPVGTGGRVDQQRGPAPRARHDIGVVVHVADRHLSDPDGPVGPVRPVTVLLDVSAVRQRDASPGWTQGG